MPIKRILIILGLAAVFLFGAHNALAQTPATSVNCFDYYHFGSIQIPIENQITNFAPGDKAKFTGKIINSNSYPIVDGQVYVKIFKKQPRGESPYSPEIVDQFVAVPDVNIPANGSVPINITWKVPENAVAGDYRISTFFEVAKSFNLLGLSFTDDVVGNGADFSISSNNSNVAFNTKAVTINGQPYYFVGATPRVTGTSTIVASLINSTKSIQTAHVTWSMYSWDALRSSALISTESEDVILNAGEKKNVTFVATDASVPVYYVVATAEYKDTKSILDIRFVRPEIDGAHLGFLSLTGYPIKAGEPISLFACANGITQESSDGGKLVMSVGDSQGNEIASSTYEGPIISQVMGFKKDFISPANYDNYTLKASLYQKGVLVDSVTLTYDCKNIDPSKCPVPVVSNSSILSDIGLAILIIIILIIIFFMIKKKHSKLLVFLFCLVAFGIFGFSGHVYADSVQFTGTYPGYYWSSPHITNTAPVIYATTTYNGATYYTDLKHPTCIPYSISDPRNCYYWIPILRDPVATITYYATIFDVTTQQNVTSNTDCSPITAGDTLQFTFTQSVPYDIFWNATGALMDTPYGNWVASAGTPPYETTKPPYNPASLSICDNPDYHFADGSGPYYYGFYLSLSVAPPIRTIHYTGTAVLGDGCVDGAVVSDGGSQSCKVISPGTIGVSFDFATTTGQLYEVIDDSNKSQPCYNSINTTNPIPQTLSTCDTSKYTNYQCNDNGPGQVWEKPAPLTIGSEIIPFNFCAHDLPDLTAGAVSPVNATVNVAKIFSATISNIGSVKTDTATSTFEDLFQISSSTANRANAKFMGTYLSSAIGPNATNTATTSYIIQPSDINAMGTTSIRVCANKTSASSFDSIIEASTTNNCGPWTDITVSTPSISSTCSVVNTTTGAGTAGSIGDAFTWSATNTTGGNGDGTYTYSWNSPDGLTTGNSSTTSSTYSSTGIKSATLTVTSGGISQPITCPTVNIQYSCLGTDPGGNYCQPTNKFPASPNTYWTSVGNSSLCPSFPANACMYYLTSGGGGGLSCHPVTTNADGTLNDPAEYANIGQLVTWEASPATLGSYSWTDNGVPKPLQTGSNYNVRYSIIGTTSVSVANGASNVTCTTTVNKLPQTYLRIVNDVNFKPF